MSHFSFTRTPYDKCALDLKDNQSTAQFNLVTDKTIPESNSVCFQSTSPFMQNPFRSIPANSVDIESDLRGFSYEMSKCPTHKFNPEKHQPVNTKLNECKDNGLVPQYTRTNKPCNMFSGITINRFHPLCENLQDVNKIHNNNFIGINTRLHLQDAFEKNKLKKQ